MNDPQQVALRRRGSFRDHFWANGDSADFDDLPSATEPTAGLISLGFVGSALRRGMTVWLVLTVIGLLVGIGLAVERPPGHSATTTVLIDSDSSSPGGELPTDIAIAESTPVAAAVVAQLKLQQTPVSFLQTYTAAAVGDSTQILTITAQGPTDDAAVQRAAAVAKQFLAFRARYLQDQLQEAITALNQQVSSAQQSLNAINRQIASLPATSTNPSEAAEIGGLPKEQSDAEAALSAAQQNAASTKLADQTTTAQMVHGSQVLSAATPARRAVKKTLLLDVIGGLLGGLMTGMAIVVIGAVTSNRLRRRDDIAIAVGAPVRLSVGRLRGRRRMPGLRENSGQRNRDMALVVEHLRSAVPAGAQGPAGLAVVAVDDVPTVARAVVQLAVASSLRRRRVVLADLSAGAQAARQLGVTAPGIDAVSPAEGVSIVLVVPETGDIAPVGPLARSSAGSAVVSERLAEASARADLIVSIVTLNPAFGGDYLKTWATDAVIVVTAGQSTAARLHAAGEMVRLAGTRLVSVVVLDADKKDESLGAVTAAYQPASAIGA